MSRDLQTVSLVDALEIIAVTEVSTSPRRLLVRGPGGYQHVIRVFINNYQVDSFELISDTKLYVLPPAAFKDTPLNQMDLSLASNTYSGGDRVVLVFGLTRNPQEVSGILQLVQQVVKLLLSNVGSNKYAREQGTSLLRNLPETLSDDQKTQLSAILAEAVALVLSQIQSAQQNQSLSASERLLSLSLDTLIFDSATSSVSARLKLVTYSGRTLLFPVVL